MRRRKRRILAAGMAVVITCSQYGSVPKAYANTGFYQIKEIEDLSDQAPASIAARNAGNEFSGIPRFLS